MSSFCEQIEKTLAICCYVNISDRIQIIKITNIANWYFERTILPGQRLVFEAPLEGKLEIHTGMMVTAILDDTIDCSDLQLTTTFPRQPYQYNRAYKL